MKIISFSRRILNHQVPGYSLVTVLILMVFLSVAAALGFRFSGAATRSVHDLQAGILRQEILKMTCGRLLAGKEFLKPGQTGSEVLEGHAFYPFYLKWKVWRWGIHDFLTVTVSDPTGSAERTIRNERKVLIPEGTSVVYDQPGFGLVLTNGTTLLGPVLLRYPELRTTRLSMQTEERPVQFTQPLYRLEIPLFQPAGEIPDAPDWSVVPENRHGSYVRILTEPLPDSLNSGWIDIGEKREIDRFPAGTGNQILIRKSVRLRAGFYQAEDLVFLGDTLLADPGTRFHGNLWVFRKPGSPPPVVILKKPFQIQGDLVADGTLRAEGAVINGRLLASQSAVNRPPTEYVHYLSGMTVTGAPEPGWNLPLVLMGYK